MEFFLISSAFLPIILVCILFLSVLIFLKTSWFKGFAGELKVHFFAKINLDKTKYHILRNVTLPTAEGTTQIDHIVVSRYGVFVIETKNMKGWIFGDSRQEMWTQKIYNYTSDFQNPLRQNHKHVETLKSLLTLNDQQILSVVAFVGNSAFKNEMPENVTDVSGLIKYIKSKDQRVLMDTDVQMILFKIEAERLAPTRETVKAHIDHVKQIIGEKQISNNNQSVSIASPFQLNDGNLYKDIDIEPAFTDSWQNRSWRFEDMDMETEFTDRVVR